MKTIALFGATGRTGTPLTSLLLKQGFSVKALVREHSSLALEHPALSVVHGNILTYPDVEQTIHGTDAVISVIGHRRGDTQSSTVQTDGIRAILRAMEQHQIQRLLSLTGGTVPFHKDTPGFTDKAATFLMRIFAKEELTDSLAHAELICSSATAWTIIRAPRLVERQDASEYRVGWAGINSGTSVSYANVARFMTDELIAGKYIHSMPYISS